MPVDYSEYHPKWTLIVRLIRRRAGNRCEGSEKFPDCRAENGSVYIGEVIRPKFSGRNQLSIFSNDPTGFAGNDSNLNPGTLVQLGCAHVDGDINNNRFWNLKYWCRRCHLSHDRGDNLMRMKYGKKFSRRHQLRLFSILNHFNNLPMQTSIVDKLNEISDEERVMKIRLINQHIEDIDRQIVTLDSIRKDSIHGLTLSGPKLDPVNFYLGQEGSLLIAATMLRYLNRRRSELFRQGQLIMERKAVTEATAQ
ncbi:MAG TPA: hypothetical protein VK658_28260 [Chryseolinea sp.]|nr:hypothetical protein [Chryseolinea sp.]